MKHTLRFITVLLLAPLAAFASDTMPAPARLSKNKAKLRVVQTGLRTATENVYSIPLLKLAILGLLFCIQG